MRSVTRPDRPFALSPCRPRSPARDRRYHRDLIPRTHRRREPVAEADVLVVEIVGHEGIRTAGLVPQPRGETREAAGDVGHDVAQGGTGALDGGLAIGQSG